VSEVAVKAQRFVMNDDNSMNAQMLTFFVDGQQYGIELSYVTDIIEMHPLTHIPLVADYIEGVINLRGKVIPIINLRLRFGKQKIEYDDRTCIVVVECDGVSVGLIIDRIGEVFKYSANVLQPAPSKKGASAAVFVTDIINIEDEVKLVLDCNKLLFS